MFYSNDHEPTHVHIIKDGHEAKYNVDPVELVYNHGLRSTTYCLLIESVIEENRDVIINRWKEYFKKD